MHVEVGKRGAGGRASSLYSCLLPRRAFEQQRPRLPMPVRSQTAPEGVQPGTAINRYSGEAEANRASPSGRPHASRVSQQTLLPGCRIGTIRALRVPAVTLTNPQMGKKRSFFQRGADAPCVSQQTLPPGCRIGTIRAFRVTGVTLTNIPKWGKKRSFSLWGAHATRVSQQTPPPAAEFEPSAPSA
jgi:hypothetical protein